MYKFPQKWHLNIKNINDLSKRFGVSIDDLKKLEANIPSHYTFKTKKEKNGKIRELYAPSKFLKQVQRLMIKKILNFDFPKYVQGGVKGRSIKTNALIHRQQKWVANLDIRQCFPSIHYLRIKVVFSDLGYSEPIAKMLSHFVSFGRELPQGAPTSPIIINLVLYNLDRRISILCKPKKLNYSRYFDDITISGNRRLDNLCKKVLKISKKEGFYIYPPGTKKFNITPDSKLQIVTGFRVNGKSLKVHKEFLSKLENDIEKLKNGKLPDIPLYKFFNQIRGMIAFLQSVQPKKARFLSDKFKQIKKDYPQIF